MRYLSIFVLVVFLSACGEQAATAGSSAAEPAMAGITDVNPLNDPAPLSELVTFNGIGPGAHLVSPYTLKGQAVRNWFHNGRFSVSIVGEDGLMIASSPGMATGNSTPGGWVPYQSKLAWIAGPGTKAKIILAPNSAVDKEAGGLRAVEIPVILK
ncbi:hypothetical protein FUA23_03420 [Neolewinella aurantiaca]|uniref:Bacterial spore germination immunoglobulin-like domain-containing protein n=1 Tax=Neolewinella aurantiaca TaxID=2602767 RepID=A0A5C7FZX5_9BACT|nr:hypothetical protein [Neolewinella aurantiaca]TXF91286.1 hypothetical protein FUA23_03420 [Neolewinella aurantiaca]